MEFPDVNLQSYTTGEFMDQLQSLIHMTRECKYHIMWISKCQKKTLYRIKESIRRSVSRVGWPQEIKNLGRAFDG